MTIEQELQALSNKYGEKAFINAINDYLSKSQENEEEKEWEHLAPMYGLPSHLYNTSFHHGRHYFFLKSIKPNNRKYPIIATRDDGKSFKFPPDIIKSYFQIQ